MAKNKQAPAKKKTLVIEVRDLYKHWLKIHAPKQAPVTVAAYKGIWKRYLLPTLGKKKLSAVTERDCVALYHSLYDKPVMANRVMAVLRAAYNLAEDWAMIPRNTNPVHVKFTREEGRERYPSPVEARALLKALKKHSRQDFSSYIMLLILTGCRPGELRKAKWEWVSHEGLRLPLAKHRKKGRLVILSQDARKVIGTLPKKSAYIFEFSQNQIFRYWQALLKESSIEALQLRDLRRYFASLVLSDGVSLDSVGQLLGHRSSQVTRRYAYLQTDVGLKAAESAASRLKKLTST